MKWDVKLWVFDHEEIKEFYTASVAVQLAFVSVYNTPLNQAHAYRIVLRMMRATGEQQCMRRTAHSVTWRRNLKHPDCKRPWRSPKAFQQLLQKFGGWLPM